MGVIGISGPLHGSESILSRPELDPFRLAPELDASDLANLAQQAHTQRFIPTTRLEAADPQFPVFCPKDAGCLIVSPSPAGDRSQGDRIHRSRR